MTNYTIVQGPRQSGVTTIAIAIAEKLVREHKYVMFIGNGPWYRDLYPVPLTMYINKSSELTYQIQQKIGLKVDCIVVDGDITPKLDNMLETLCPPTAVTTINIAIAVERR